MLIGVSEVDGCREQAPEADGDNDQPDSIVARALLLKHDCPRLNGIAAFHPETVTARPLAVNGTKGPSVG